MMRRRQVRRAAALILVLCHAGCEKDGPEGEAAADTEERGGAMPLSLPFRVTEDLVLLEAHLGDDGPFNVILDTGVNPSVIDLATARARGMPVQDKRPLAAQGVGTSSRPVYPARIEGLTLGSRVFPAIPAVAMDLAAMETALGRPLHGALGYSFLHSRAVRIDYPGRMITVYDGPAPIGTEDGQGLPARIVDTSLMVDSVFVNGRRVGVHLDTGAGPALTISTDAVDRLGLADVRAEAVAGQVRGARGTAPVWRATVDSIRVGGAVVSDVEVAFAPWVQGADGILGNGFLRHFVLVLDYAAGSVHIGTALTDQ